MIGKEVAVALENIQETVAEVVLKTESLETVIVHDPVTETVVPEIVEMVKRPGKLEVAARRGL